MKLKLNLHGISIECEYRPMPEHRFKALCLLAAAGVYGGMMCKVAALCGFLGVAVVAAATLLAALIACYEN